MVPEKEALTKNEGTMSKGHRNKFKVVPMVNSGKSWNKKQL